MRAHPAGSSSFTSAARMFLAGSKRRSADSEPARSCRSTASVAASASCVSVAEPDADTSACTPITGAASDTCGSAMVSMTISSGGPETPLPPSELAEGSGLRSTATFAARSTSMSSFFLSKRRAGPDDLHPFELQPSAVAVSDSDPRDLRIPGEDVLHTVERDFSIGC